MTTPEGEQVISSGWCAGEITNAPKNSDTCLEPLDPFADIDPLLSEPSVEQDESNMLQIHEGLIQHLLSEDETNSCDSEWEFEDGNVFGVIAQELWFVNFINFLQSYIQITLHWTLSSFSQFLSFHFIKLFSIKMENVNFHSTAIPRKFLTIKYFYRFLSIFWIFWHFLFTKKLPMTSLVTDDVSIFSLSIYFK